MSKKLSFLILVTAIFLMASCGKRTIPMPINAPVAVAEKSLPLAKLSQIHFVEENLHFRWKVPKIEDSPIRSFYLFAHLPLLGCSSCDPEETSELRIDLLPSGAQLNFEESSPRFQIWKKSTRHHITSKQGQMELTLKKGRFPFHTYFQIRYFTQRGEASPFSEKVSIFRPISFEPPELQVTYLKGFFILEWTPPTETMRSSISQTKKLVSTQQKLKLRLYQLNSTELAYPQTYTSGRIRLPKKGKGFYARYIDRSGNESPPSINYVYPSETTSNDQ